MAKQAPPPSCAWSWMSRILGPIGGAAVMGSGLLALMGHWWLWTCGPVAVVAGVATAVWYRVGRIADGIARLNADTVRRWRERKQWAPPKGDP